MHIQILVINKKCKQINFLGILSLATSEGSNIFVSGGEDGKVIIWELGSR